MLSFSIIMDGIFMNLIGFMGIVGNIISMIIFSRTKMKSSINWVLVLLGLCDILTILSYIFIKGIHGLYLCLDYELSDTYIYKVQPLLNLLLYPSTFIIQTVSGYLTLMVSTERFLAARNLCTKYSLINDCHSIKDRFSRTRTAVQLVALLVIVFSVLYNIPRFCEITLEYETVDNETVYWAVTTDLTINPIYKFYATWLFWVLIHIIPLASLVVLNWMLYNQIWQITQERHQLTYQQKKEINLANMWLCDSSLFALCKVFVVVEIFFLLFSSIGIYDDYYVIMTMKMINDYLAILNCSINILIYTCFNKMFRQQLIEIFCSFCIKSEKKMSAPYRTVDVNKSSNRAEQKGGSDVELGQAKGNYLDACTLNFCSY